MKFSKDQRKTIVDFTKLAQDMCNSYGGCTKCPWGNHCIVKVSYILQEQAEQGD